MIKRVLCGKEHLFFCTPNTPVPPTTFYLTWSFLVTFFLDVTSLPLPLRLRWGTHISQPSEVLASWNPDVRTSFQAKLTWGFWTRPVFHLNSSRPSAATVENSSVAPQKAKRKITIWPSNATSREVPKRSESRGPDPRPPVHTAALPAVAKTWKHGWTRCGLYVQWAIIQPEKGREFWQVLQHAWTSETLC